MKQVTPSEMRYYLHLEPSIDTVSDALIQNIHSMEPHIAYVLLGGHLAPLLQSKEVHLQKERPLLRKSNVPSPLGAIQKAPINKLELQKILKPILEGFKEIEGRIQEVKENYEKMFDNMSISSVNKDGYISKRIKEKIFNKKNGFSPLDLTKTWLGRFIGSRKFIDDQLQDLEKKLEKIKKYTLFFTTKDREFSKGIKRTNPTSK